ncbi:divergent polysaccharide deacetylase family protein [Phaeobacter sp. J2-8]|uniref:divergent polysaccharide deacetylase family protein n=1 Tax=Phaeobacter sp. J2-8 TaxID=2931394 RepID=UPI001FD3E4E3|nr:divergent polysaccharide deacetylase family protein [Phaeobacter sp. J2-8]MCJ7873620.1 divergent polysaccharide deacetylase family protein [Phaeobacter sp. J2-8]
MAQGFFAGALWGVVVAGLGAGTLSVLTGPVVAPKPEVTAATTDTPAAPPANEPDALPRSVPLAEQGDDASPQTPSPGIPEPENDVDDVAVADTASTGLPETGGAVALNAAPDLEPPDRAGAGLTAGENPITLGGDVVQPDLPAADELSISSNPAQPPAPLVEEVAPRLGSAAPVADAEVEAPEAESPVVDLPATADSEEADPVLAEDAADPAVTSGETAAPPEVVAAPIQVTPEPEIVADIPPVVTTEVMTPQSVEPPRSPSVMQPGILPDIVLPGSVLPDSASREPAPLRVTETPPDTETSPNTETLRDLETSGDGETPRDGETLGDVEIPREEETPRRPLVTALIDRDPVDRGEDRPSVGTPVGTLGNLAPTVRTGRLPTLGGSDATAEQGSDTNPDTSQATQRPIEAFAVDMDVAPDKPMMSIILIDDGKTPLGLEALESFPYPITFAVDTGWSGAAAAMRSYRDAGFEVMALADLPPGAQAQDAEVTLASALDLVPEAVGVLEGGNSGLQENRGTSEQVARILADTGHGLVLYPKGLNTGQALAARAGVPSATLFRDFDSNGQTATVIRRFLDQAAFKAGQEGAVIMLGRLRAETISALLIWGLQDRASRVTLVPVSKVLLADAQEG